jgi:ferredoxin
MVTARIEIDPTKCMGSGNCVFWAPGVFDIGEDNVSYVMDRGAASERLIEKAAEGCPTQAISLVIGESQEEGT